MKWIHKTCEILSKITNLERKHGKFQGNGLEATAGSHLSYPCSHFILTKMRQPHFIMRDLKPKEIEKRPEINSCLLQCRTRAHTQVLDITLVFAYILGVLFSTHVGQNMLVRGVCEFYENVRGRIQKTLCTSGKYFWEGCSWIFRKRPEISYGMFSAKLSLLYLISQDVFRVISWWLQTILLVLLGSSCEICSKSYLKKEG